MRYEVVLFKTDEGYAITCPGATGLLVSRDHQRPKPLKTLATLFACISIICPTRPNRGKNG